MTDIRLVSFRSVLTILILVPVAGCHTETIQTKGKGTDSQSQQENNQEMFNSPLQRAISRGMAPGGDLADELKKLDDYSLHSRKDARDVCKALTKLPFQPSDGDGISSPLHALTALFQDVDPDAPAFDVLYEEGLPQLMRIFDEEVKHVDEENVDDLLFVLKILARYGSREGAERIVGAARRPLKDAYMWHEIFSAFTKGHPQRDYMFEALSDPLPAGFIAVALLDSANQAAVEEELSRHPFDSEAGWKRLQDWLEDQDPGHFSYAYSATAALPFLSNPPRDQFLALAMDHIDANVQLKAAWAAAKLGREAGLKILTRFCLDVNHLDDARFYLAELNREDLIPAEATDPSFLAKADFARWLAHPNELGQPPDELEIIDHRELAWPPEREPKPFWLIRFLLRDRTGLKEDQVDCGLVGSMTWCFFSYKMRERPPEDVYAIHCYWEMEHAKLIGDVEITDATEYDGMLDLWPGSALQGPQVTLVANLSPELRYPGRQVALASATLDGKEGWAVLDGARSAWYPKAEQPEDTSEGVVLKIHVGRQLLGFEGQPDRKKYLATDRPRRAPEQIIAAYEKLLAEAAQAEPERQKELLGGYDLLSEHFDAYVESLVAVNDAAKPDIVIDVYNRFLQLAEQADASIRDEVYDITSVLGEEFDAYGDALVSRGRSNEIVRLIELLAPHWDNDLGYGRLGGAAFKAGRRDIAEPLLVKLRNVLENYYRSAEMDLLAQIWHDRGDVEHARELLIDCMRRLAAEIPKLKYDFDRKRFADDFELRRSTYLRLFPDSENELTRLGIPANPL